MRTDSLGVDWEALLADDGSMPYTPHAITPHVTVDVDALPPAPKRAAVAPRQRQRPDDGIHVVEGTGIGVSGIVDCALFIETRWSCPRCQKSYSKRGRHSGSLKTCRTPGCGARFFLRMVPMR